MGIGRYLLSIATTALAIFLAAPAHAQTLAYVVGQRDDPAPGNSGIQVVSVIDAATNTIVASIPVGLAVSVWIRTSWRLHRTAHVSM